MQGVSARTTCHVDLGSLGVSLTPRVERVGAGPVGLLPSLTEQPVCEAQRG